MSAPTAAAAPAIVPAEKKGDPVYRSPVFFVMVGCYIYIVVVALGYQTAWVFPEALKIKWDILKDGLSFTWEDWRRGLDFWSFEWAPRIGRPLSSYFEILDTRLRVWLWNFVPPHPSLSLTLIFSLGLSPWLLYRLLRNLKVKRDAALAGVVLYLVNPATLSHVSMLFRPAKALANFSILLCLYLASRGPRNFPRFCAICFASFFWDETALLLYPAALLFFGRGLFTNAGQRLAFAMLPAFVFLSYAYLLPAMARWAGYLAPNFMQYEHVNHLGAVLSFQRLPDLCTDFVGFAQSLAGESLGITPDWARSGASVTLTWVNLILLLSCLTYFGWKQTTQGWHSDRLLTRSLIGVVAAIAAHTLLMNLTSIHAWGLYWYGGYFAVFLAIFAASFLQRLKLHPYLLSAGLAAVALGNFQTFESLTDVYLRVHYYSANLDPLVQLFQGDASAIAEVSAATSGLFVKTLGRWQEHPQGLPADGELPKELLYLALERGWLIGSETGWLQIAARLGPYSANAHTDLGATFAHQGKPAEAKREYLEALRIDPKHVLAHHNLANLLLQEGDIATASRLLDKKSELDPATAFDNHLQLADALFRAERYQEAISRYREALKIRPRDAQVQNSLAGALAALELADKHNKRKP